MTRGKVPYKEGEWFSIPLRDGGYAVGVVARIGSKGAFLGYFFGPRWTNHPRLDDVRWNRSDSAILVAIVGDLGLLRGEWKALGVQDGWSRERWPLPRFSRKDAVSGTVRIVSYAEDDLLRETDIQNFNEAEATQLPEDGVWGYGALEKRISSLLGFGRQ